MDHWLGHGLNPLWFHISTFCWFILQLWLMFVLFRRTCEAARPDPRDAPNNAWIAMAATAVYALHPAMPETVNYIMQRGEIYSTLAVVAGLVLYIAFPAGRRFGLYLAPVAVGMFAKEPAAVFPALLFVWIWLFEQSNLRKAFLRSVPAFAVTGAIAVLIMRMYAPTFVPGAVSAWNYRISQPAVIATYFQKFFIPAGFSADSDRMPYSSILDPSAITGFIFVAMLAALAIWCSRQRDTKPIAFGLAWFLIAPIPTSWVGLAEVENDHRLFFPFAGLALATVLAAALGISRRSIPRPVWATAFGLLLAGFAWGAHERNKVWHTEESLWYDVTVKSPKNGRGLMNYGLSQMEAGRLEVALDYFQRALPLTPNYPALEVNLGVVNGAMNRDAEAERHFARAISLSPREAVPRYFYAVWLNRKRRLQESAAQLKIAVASNPGYIDADHLLMQVYASQADRTGLKALAAETLSRFPSDPDARFWLAKADKLPSLQAAGPTADGFLNQSLAYYRAGRFQDSITAAREALKLKPDSAEAWNNTGAAYNSLSEWDQGIEACEQALKLRPGWQLAQNNLAWAKSGKNGPAAAGHN